jgi:hypothetical protein
MDWLSQNWIWVLAAILAAVIVVRGSRSRQAGQHPSRVLLAAILSAFYDIIVEVLGRQYSPQDCQKIAVGMVAVMAMERLTLQDLERNPNLVLEVAAKSAVILSKNGAIAPIG